jgi:hypothetical protein
MKHFKTELKKIDKMNKEIKIIQLDKIYAQYNPDRFKQLKSVFDKDELDNNILNMKYSPHFDFLNNIIGQKNIFEKLIGLKYYEMQKKYGRNKRWIYQKVTKFIILYNDIKLNGYDMDKKIIVLNKPLIQNKYNNGFELFEGHHRLSCLLHLGYNEIECLFVNN